MFSSPTVVGDLVFIGSCSGTFYALDRETGTVRWSYDTTPDGGPVSIHGDPALADGLIVIGTDGGKVAYVYAFEQKTGKVRWKYQVTTPAANGSGLSTDILREGDNLHGTAQGDELLCLDFQTGRIQWRFSSRFDRSQPAWSNAPALEGRVVFFGGKDGLLYALDADSGRLIWQKKVSTSAMTSPVLFGGNVYVGKMDGTFSRLRASDGELLGSVSLPGRPWRSITRAGSDLLVQAQELAWLDLAANKVRWSTKPPEGAEWMTARPYVWKDLVLAANNKGHLLACRLSDGTLAWSHIFPGQKLRGLGVTDEVLYAGSITGMVYAFRPPAQQQCFR